MSTAADRKKIEDGVTQELLKDKLIQELGQKAIVERTQIQNERMDELRAVIGDVGRDLEAIGAVPKGLSYCGSLSVHVFKSEILGTAAFAVVNNIENLTISLADGALRELNGSTKESYGKSRQKLRSGF